MEPASRPEPPGADAVTPADATELRLNALIAWMESELDLVKQHDDAGYAARARVWEPLLGELARFEDKDLYERFARSERADVIQGGLRERFLEYAHLRDLARSESILEKYAARRRGDRLSRDMTIFLEREEERLTRVLPPSADPALVAVGCGASPDTFLFYATGRVGFRSAAALEVDERACALARRTLRRLGLGSARVEHVDGRSFDYGGFAVIHVANYVIGKRAVLEAVAATASPGAVVIVRTPKLLERLLCPSIEGAEIDGLREVTRISSQYCQMDSVFLRRA